MKGKGINLNIQTEDRFTALHFAGIKNSLLSTRLLIALGAQTNLQDGRGEIPLHHAARNGHLEAVRYLLRLELMAPKYPKVDEVTPANYAVFVERAIELQLLVSERATVKVSSRDKDIALQIAEVNGHAEIATLRLAKAVHPRLTVAFGSSPLYGLQWPRKAY